MFISVGFPDNSISVGMVQGHVYFCRYFSLTRGFLSVLFAGICIFDSSDSERLYSCRGFFQTHAFLSVLFLDIYTSVSETEHPVYLSVLFRDTSTSVSSDSEHPVCLLVLLPDTYFCRVDFPDVSISLR
jgi:hypothetical protein